MRRAVCPLLFAGTMSLAAPGNAAEVELLQHPTILRLTAVGAGRASAPVRFDADAAFALEPGDRATVSLADGVSYPVVFERAVAHASGNRTWIGRVDAPFPAGRVIVTHGHAGSFGSFALPEGEFVLRTSAGRQELARSAPGAPDGTAWVDDSVHPPPDAAVPATAPASRPALPNVKDLAADAATETTTVDLMILYTPTLATRYGDALQARLEHLVALANQAYVDSRIGVTLRLVHVERVEYSESEGARAALDALARSENPALPVPLVPSLAHVAALRTEKGADLVALVRPLVRAHTPGSSAGYFAVGRRADNGELVAFPTFGYSVVSDGEALDAPGFTAFESNLAHEIGHNFGAQHDRAHASSPGVFAYSHGYGVRFVFATVMAHGYIEGPRLNLFSNPDLSCPRGPCGIYETNPAASANNALTLNNTRHLIAAFRMPVDAPPNYQGLWWNAPAGSESGWGINFAHQGDVIFATWYTYDATGKALWLVMTAHKSAAGTYTGTIYRTRGPAFDSTPFAPDAVTAVAVGAGTLSFDDAGSGTFAYEVDGTAQTKSITRQVFGPLPVCVFAAQADLAFATNYQDLWWAAPAGVESGWGVNFTHQGDVIFATWFTYDTDGSPLWLSAIARRAGRNVYAGPLYRTRGPAFNSVPFQPTEVSATYAGELTLTFAHGNSATFAYTVNGVTQTKSIVRQVFRAPGTVCQ